MKQSLIFIFQNFRFLKEEICDILLFENKVPGDWKKRAFESLTGSWSL